MNTAATPCEALRQRELTRRARSWADVREASNTERGTAAVELLMIAPVLMLTCLLLMQWTVHLEAARVVDAAAREGAVAAAAWDGDAAAGRETALDYLADLDPQVTHRAATAVRRGQEAVVTVEGTVASLIPGLHLQVSATATVPTERFVP